MYSNITTITIVFYNQHINMYSNITTITIVFYNNTSTCTAI